MVSQAPPQGARMDPCLATVPAGTELWRCHSSRWGATTFKEKPAHTHFGASRFDGTTDDAYPYLYAAEEPTTALAEVLVRSTEFSSEYGVRQIPWRQAAGHTLTKVRTTEDLVLIRLLSEEDLAGVLQSSWLLEAEHHEYAQTRFWAQEMRRQVPQAQGLVWTSRRHRPRPAIVLFGDRCTDQPLVAVPGAGSVYDLATLEGLHEANRLLVPLRTVIVPPGWEF